MYRDEKSIIWVQRKVDNFRLKKVSESVKNVLSLLIEANFTQHKQVRQEKLRKHEVFPVFSHSTKGEIPVLDFSSQSLMFPQIFSLPKYLQRL
jgi:hypothetical protein